MLPTSAKKHRSNPDNAHARGDVSILVFFREVFEAKMNATNTERIAALEQAVDRLSDELEKEREARKQAERKAEAAVSHVRELWAGIEDYQDYREYNERDKATIRQDVSEAHEQANDPTPAACQESAPEDPPLYDVLRTPESKLEPRERRTAFLWKDLKDYSRKCPAGRVITNPELRRVLAAAEPEDGATIDSTIARRVMELSDDLTRGAVTVEKEAGRWRMVIPPDWKEKAREAHRDAERTPEEAPRSDSAVS